MTQRLQIYTLRDRQIHTENQVQALMVRPKSCWKKLLSKCSVFLFTWSAWVNLHYGWLFACEMSSSWARRFWDLYRSSVPCIALEVKITSQFSPLAIKSMCLPVHLLLWHVGLLILLCGGLWAQSWKLRYFSTQTLQEEWIKVTGIIFQTLIINKEACLCLFQFCSCMKMSRLANNWDLAAAAACVFTSLLSFFRPTAAVMLVLSG